MVESEEKSIRCKCRERGELVWKTKIVTLKDGRKRKVRYMQCNKCGTIRPILEK